MRLIFVLLVLSSVAWPQALTEAAAAVAGGSAGGVAGKKVGEGVGSILQKVAATAAKAADAKPSESAAAAIEVGPGVPRLKRSVDRSLVPPPPPPAHKVTAKVELPLLPDPVQEMIAPPPPPPPPPVATPDDLRTLTNGMGRLAVLKLGAPASRVSMVEGGHLLEIYRYANSDMSFGVVRLNDGVVASVEVRP